MLVGLPTTLLTPDEESALISDGTLESRQKIIIHAMRSACHYAQVVCKGNVDGEDIFSACYDALCHSINNYKPGKRTFFAYSKPFIRGEVFKAFRAMKAVKHSFIVQMENDDTDDDLLRESSGEFDFDAIHRREQLELIRTVADKHLSEQERLVLELRDFGRLTFIDIKNVLGCSRTNVQQIYGRAIKKIKKKVAVLHRDAQYKNVSA